MLNLCLKGYRLHTKRLLISGILVTLVAIAGCSSVEITRSGEPDSRPSSADLSLDVNVYFAPENAEPATGIEVVIPGPGWVKLEVLNATGYRVRLLLDEELEYFSGPIYWDGKNDHGRSIKSGIYMYRLQWEDQFAVTLAPFCRTVAECEEMFDEN